MESLFGNIEVLIATNPLLAFVAVFVAGLLVRLTPCVYPVIPLTLAYIGARSAGSRWRGFGISLVYVSGMAVTYAVLGAFASLSGQLFGLIGSHPLTYFIVANVCLLLALSMLGVFEIPQIQLASSAGNSQKKKGLVGAFFMGVLSGLIVGPCTAPVLAAILVYVGSQKNLFYGFGLLLTFGYGIGFIFVIAGTFAGLLSSLPKSGQWLTRIKQGFGWAMLLAAEYLFIKMGGLL